MNRISNVAIAVMVLAGMFAFNKPQNTPPADNGSAATQDANAMATNDVSNGTTSTPATNQ
jgi:hypothetical protein